MSSEHLLEAVSSEPPIAVLAGTRLGSGSLVTLPAWAREEGEEVTEIDDADEHRAESVAQALMSSAPPTPVLAGTPLGSGSLVTLPAWAREEGEEVAEVDDADEHRAEGVAQALLSSAPPRDEPTDPAEPAAPDGRAGSDRDGEALPLGVRRWAERRTGADLRDVRVYRSREASRRAASLGAHAFTQGRHIVWGAETVDPYAGEGLATLAHEIGHVVAPPAGGRIGRKPMDEVKRVDRVIPNNDPEGIVDKIPWLMDQLDTVVWDDFTRDKVWDAEAQKNNAPDLALLPKVIIIVSENIVVMATSTGEVATVEPRDPKKFDTGQFIEDIILLDFSTGVAFAFFIGTKKDGTETTVLRPESKRAPDAKATPGESAVIFRLHGWTMPDDVIARMKARIGKAGGKSGGGGGQGDVDPWVKSQVDDLKKRLAKKAGDPQGTDPKGQGKGDSGEGKGAGHGKGDGVGDGDQAGMGGSGNQADPNAEPKAPVGTTDDKPLQGPVQLVPWNSKEGTAGVAIGQDRAWSWMKLLEGEDPAATEKRLDKAIKELQDSRDPNNSTKVANGARGILVDPKQTSGQVVNPTDATQQAKTTAGAAVPGQRIPGARGGANAMAYPSRMLLTGKDPDPKVPAMTVSGATNDFTMDLDYAALSLGLQDEVWNRLQLISFYWEVIDVSQLTKDKAAQTKATKGDTQMSQDEADRHLTDKLGKGEQERGGSGFTSTVHRDMKAIAEDEANDLKMMSDENWPWDARAEYLMVIGISNIVRTLGSIIGAFVDLLAEPLNERKIGFSDEGDYLVRCVATPIVDDEARAHPEKHTIRASSVAVMPIRVQAIHTRAQNAVQREEADLTARQAALDTAIKDGASASKIAVLQDDLKNAQDASHRSGLNTYEAQVVQVKHSLEVAKALRDHLADGTPDEKWSDDEARLKLELFRTKTSLFDHIKRLEEGLKGLTGDDHEQWAIKESNKIKPMHGISDVRPRVVLASEETGQVTELTCMLGEATEDVPGVTTWRLVDITSANTRKAYEGTSKLTGTAGKEAAIRDCFRNLAENGDYGRGTLAIRLPAELTTYLGGEQISYPTEMRSAPGKGGRFMQRLKDIAKVAAIAGLFMTGGAAVMVGAVGGVAGAIVAVDSLINRGQTGHLWDIGTIFDALGVLGGVAALAGVGTYLARETVVEMAKVGKVPKWLNGLERTEKVLHLHAQFGIVQQIVTIPIELVMEWSATEDLPQAQKDSRRLRALLHAVESGLMTVAMLNGPLAGEEKQTEEGGGKASSEEANKAADSTPPASKPPTKNTGEPGATPKDTGGAGTRPSADTAPPAPRKSVAELQQEAGERAREMAARADRAAVKQSRGEEEVEPDTQRKPPAPPPETTAPSKIEVRPEHAAAREKAVELLAKRVGTDRQITAPADPTPPQPGTYGPRIKVAADAVAIYDRAVASSGGREVGLYFNPRTGEFQVEIGTPHEVNPPDPDWQAVVHLHPNPENVLTYRLPAPQDIAMSLKAAKTTGPHTEFVQSVLPDGSTGVTKVTVTAGDPPSIVVERPPSGGQPGETITASSVEEYADKYSGETRGVDLNSEAGAWLLKNIADFYAGRESEGQTGGGAAQSPKKRAETRIKNLRKNMAKTKPESDEAQALADDIEKRLTKLSDEAGTRDVNPDLDSLEKDVRAAHESKDGPDDRPKPLETPHDTTPVPDPDALPLTADRKNLLERIGGLKAKVRRAQKDLDKTSLKPDEKAAMKKVYDKDLEDLDRLKEPSPDRDIAGELDDFNANFNAAKKAATPVDPTEVNERAATIRRKAGKDRQEAIDKATAARTKSTDAQTAAKAATDAEATELAAPAASRPEDIKAQQARRAELALARTKAESAAKAADRAAAKAEAKRDQVSARSDDLEAIADKMDGIAKRRREEKDFSGRADFESLRRDARIIDRQDGEVVVDLTAGTMRADVKAWIEKRAGTLLKSGDLGTVLLARVLEFVATADTLTLKQSPRTAGDGSTPTPSMQKACEENLAAGRYDSLTGYRDAFNEALSRAAEQGRDWPIDSGGASWEVDHVGELWLGGADDPSNFLAVPKGVHKAKSDLFTDFRRTFRVGRIADDQTDVRESGGAVNP